MVTRIHGEEQPVDAVGEIVAEQRAKWDKRRIVQVNAAATCIVLYRVARSPGARKQASRERATKYLARRRLGGRSNVLEPTIAQGVPARLVVRLFPVAGRNHARVAINDRPISVPLDAL